MQRPNTVNKQQTPPPDAYAADATESAREKMYCENVAITAGKLAAYLRERAKAEGVAMMLTPEWFEAQLDTGILRLFGIAVDVGRRELLSDEQEPKSGFLEEWRLRTGSSIAGLPGTPTSPANALTAIMTAWKELRGLENQAAVGGRYVARNVRVADCLLERDADALDRKLADAQHALVGSISASECFACRPDSQCESCDRAGHIIGRIVRAHRLCEELWDMKPYRTICENPAEAVFADTLDATAELLALGCYSETSLSNP